jgi:hypothetical protein
MKPTLRGLSNLIPATLKPKPMIEIPSPERLKTALIALSSSESRLAALHAEVPELRKKMADYIANGDRTEERELLKIAAWEVRVKMVPEEITREESRKYAATEELFKAEEELAAALVERGKQEHESRFSQIKALLMESMRPIALDEDEAENVARVAAGSFRVNHIPRVVHALPVSRREPGERQLNPHALDLNIEKARKRAEELLAYHGEIISRGRIAKHPFPKVEGETIGSRPACSTEPLIQYFFPGATQPPVNNG